MPKKRKKKTPRRKRGHYAIGSAMNIDRRQEPERRAGEIQGGYVTCKGCGSQKRLNLPCSNCSGH